MPTYTLASTDWWLPPPMTCVLRGRVCFRVWALALGAGVSGSWESSWCLRGVRDLGERQRQEAGGLSSLSTWGARNGRWVRGWRRRVLRSCGQRRGKAAHTTSSVSKKPRLDQIPAANLDADDPLTD
ncbi:hypothetical protein MC885_007570, partial [Smutsia gigantea]